MDFGLFSSLPKPYSSSSELSVPEKQMQFFFVSNMNTNCFCQLTEFASVALETFVYKIT
jgi:hypothetical protein